MPRREGPALTARRAERFTTRDMINSTLRELRFPNARILPQRARKAASGLSILKGLLPVLSHPCEERERRAAAESGPRFSFRAQPSHGPYSRLFTRPNAQP
jgi:hypothetical protein